MRFSLLQTKKLFCLPPFLWNSPLSIQFVNIIYAHASQIKENGHTRFNFFERKYFIIIFHNKIYNLFIHERRYERKLNL